MNLLSCYVLGFGRMDHEEFDFKAGFNSFLEENGRGKTSLSVFLKSMLYGMPYSPRRKELSERTHYAPWNGGAYGGSLTIETEKGIYRIERTFGKTDKEDEFKLINKLTEEECDDYSKNIGEELFGLDRESFERTVFMPEDSLDTGITDRINAKMGDLSNVKDDINNFDNAIKKLDEAKKEYVRKSQNPGKLVRLREEIREKRERTENLPDLRNAYNKQWKLLSEREENLNSLLTEKNLISEQIIKNSEKEQELGAYRQKKLKHEENLLREKALKELFKNKVPRKEEIEEKLEEERNLRLDQSLLQEKNEELLDVSEEQRLKEIFKNGVIPEEDILSYTADAERLRELRISTEHAKMSKEDQDTYQELKFYFSKLDPTEDELKEAQDNTLSLAVISGQENDLLTSKEKTEEEIEKKKKSSHEKGFDRRLPAGAWLSLILSLILFLGAGAFYYFRTGSVFSYIMMGTMLLFGVIVLVVGLVLSLRQKKVVTDDIRESEERLDDIEKRLVETREEKEKTEKFVMDFLSNFLVSPSDSKQQMIAEIQRKSDLYHRLMEEENNLIKKSSGDFEELTEIELRLYTALHPYEKVYGKDLYHDNSELELIKKIDEDRESYILLSERKKELIAIRERIQKRQKSLADFLLAFVFSDKDSSLLNHLNTLLLSLEQLSSLERELLSEEEEIREFEEKHDVNEETVPVTELQKKQDFLDESITEQKRIIEKDRENLNSLSDEISNLEDLYDDIDSLTELKAEYERRVLLIENTTEYLIKAKEQFLSRYMAPLRKGLKKYLSLIYKNTDEDINVNNFTLDMDLSVRFTKWGRTVGPEYLSAGYKNLLSLSARMALIDILYENEQPMIFLDDPFTSMDEEKIKNALSLLSALSKERQIIYFTCHRSRMP